MKKRLLTLSDLAKFCRQNQYHNFSSEESGYQLCVQVPASFKQEKNEDEGTLLYATVKAFHTGVNRNHSSVTEEAAKKAMKTMAYKPILANFTVTDDGEVDFTSHDIDVDDDGNIVYLEHQIGCFTADEPYMEQDPNNEDRQYVYARAAIPKEYTAAADVIKRKNGTKVSVELLINEMAYDVEKKELLLTDVEVAGLTCLGTNPETGEKIEEGMQGARLDIEDFSFENNSMNFAKDEKTLEIMQGLKESLDNYICAFAETKNQGKEETENVDNFEENVEVTETTDAVEETTTEEESTEEVTVTEDESNDDVTPSEDFAEVKRPKDPGPNSDENDSDYDIVPEPIEQSDNDDMIIIPEDPKDDNASTDQNNTDQTNTNTTEPDNTNANTTNTTTTDPDPNDNNLSDPTDNDQPLSYSVNFNGVTKDFAVSLTEKLNALYQLVNDTYAEADNDFYNVDAFEENKTVLMHGFFSGKSYRQKYATKKDVYSLQGDRVEVFATYLTRDEQAQLENMKSSYSEIETELNKFKAEPEKMEILNSEDYSSIAGSDEFVEFKKQDAHFDMTVDEVRAKADEMLLNAAKHGNVEFAKVEPKTVEMKKIIPASKKRSGRYGNLFNK